MNYKVAVFDIDGTLTNSHKEITPKTYDAIMQLQKQGVTVVIASGRPTPGVIPIAKKLHLEQYGGYILSFNGGKITNCQTGQVIYNQVLPTHLLDKASKLAKQYNSTTLIQVDESVYTDKADNQYAQLEAGINGLTLKEIPDFSTYYEHPLNKIMVVNDADILEPIVPVFQRELGDEANVFRSEPFFLEIVPTGVDKATSLSHLLTHMNLRREDMAAFGDGYNDLTMIEYAGMGIAMENAQESVKAIADFITRSNDKDGIVYAIEQLF